MKFNLPQLVVGLLVVGAVASSNRVAPATSPLVMQSIGSFKPDAIIEVRPASVTSRATNLSFGFGFASNASTVSVQGREEIHFSMAADIGNLSDPKCSKHSEHCMVFKPGTSGTTDKLILTQVGASVRVRKLSDTGGGIKLKRARLPMGAKMDRITLSKNETVVRVGSLYVAIKT